MAKKEDRVITEDDEIVTSFCRLYVLFNYITKNSTVFPKNEIVSFSKLFSIISLMVTSEDLVARVGRENFITKARDFFKENNKLDCLVLKNEYVNTISMPETNKDFINIRKVLFTYYFESFCTKEELNNMSSKIKITNKLLEDGAVDDNEESTDLVQ